MVQKLHSVWHQEREEKQLIEQKCLQFRIDCCFSCGGKINHETCES